MEIKFKGQIIENFPQWEDAFKNYAKKQDHWKKGRSAYSLAEFILNSDGLSEIKLMVNPIINQDFEFESVEIEKESKFDNYGTGRFHDLGIFGKTKNGQKLFIGVEAKVDEEFGSSISDNYFESKVIELNGKNTNKYKRIEDLLKSTFVKVKKSDFELRYQLLHATAGTLSEVADIYIILVLVFKTELYNKEKGSKNYKDLQAFLKRLNAVKTSEDYYTTNINNKKMNIIYKEIDY